MEIILDFIVSIHDTLKAGLLFFYPSVLLYFLNKTKLN